MQELRVVDGYQRFTTQPLLTYFVPLPKGAHVKALQRCLRNIVLKDVKSAFPSKWIRLTAMENKGSPSVQISGPDLHVTLFASQLVATLCERRRFTISDPIAARLLPTKYSWEYLKKSEILRAADIDTCRIIADYESQELFFLGSESDKAIAQHALEEVVGLLKDAKIRFTRCVCISKSGPRKKCRQLLEALRSSSDRAMILFHGDVLNLVAPQDEIQLLHKQPIFREIDGEPVGSAKVTAADGGEECCPLCLDVLQSHNIRLGCGHRYCVECLSAMFAAAVNSGERIVLPVCCLHEGCGAPMSVAEIRRVGPRALASIATQHRASWSTRTGEPVAGVLFAPCPQTSCQGFVSQPPDAVIHARC
jgi:hypothetical protein